MFAAAVAAATSPRAGVLVLEKGPHFLAKVRISGGGRCNVTHACFDPRELSTRYPRGGSALLGPFQVFQPRDTIQWFTDHGVRLKTEADGRMFPVTNSSQTIIDCLLGAARAAGAELAANQGVERVACGREGGFELELTSGKTLHCTRLMLATGGCRALAAGHLAASLGHTLELPVPSLFTFQIEMPWLGELAGVTVESAEISIPEDRLREQGPLLITHRGLSGPAVLRLSAWGARVLHHRNYQFRLRVNWVPNQGAEVIGQALQSRRSAQPARFVVNTPCAQVPARLWERLVILAGIPRDTRWAALSRSAQHQLVLQLTATELPVVGKSLNKDEFVTCGGVRLSEVNFKTMESRICPGLFFGGELLDIDGLTGGFNFQAAWTTGWIAGSSLAADFATPVS